MTWHERRLRDRLVPDELLEIPSQALLELAALEVARVDAQPALHRLADAVVDERDRRLDVLLGDRVGAGDGARQLLVEALQRRVEDRAAEHPVDLLVDRRGSEVPLDEPRRGARDHPLEIGHRERVPSAEEAKGTLAGHLRRPLEGADRAVETSRPTVRRRERRRVSAIPCRELRDRAQPLPLGRSSFELARQRGERPPRRLVPHVVCVEELANALPERARLARRPLVADGLADEHEAPSRSRADGREEVAVAARLVGPDETATAALVELATRLVVEERLGARPSRQRSLLETEHDDRVEATRPRPAEIEHGDAPRRPGTLAPNGRPLEREKRLVPADRRPGFGQGLQLVECARDGIVGPEIRAGVPVDGRRRGAVRVPQHRGGEPPDGGERGVLREHEVERRKCSPVAQLDRDGDRAVAAGDPAAAQPSLDPVHVTPRESRVRRAQVGVELGALPVQPREAE